MSTVTERFQATIPAAAVGADTSTVVAESHVAGSVTAVTYTPSADITGAATNSRTISLVNKGTDGNGTAVVATLALLSGVNASDFDEKALTLSTTAADLVVAKGDVLAFTSTHVGTGIADPGGRVEVEVERSA